MEKFPKHFSTSVSRLVPEKNKVTIYAHKTLCFCRKSKAFMFEKTWKMSHSAEKILTRGLFGLRLFLQHYDTYAAKVWNKSFLV